MPFSQANPRKNSRHSKNSQTLSLLDLAQAFGRDAVPLRQPRPQVRPRPHHRGHARVQRRRRAQHGRRPPGLRRRGQINGRLPQAGPVWHRSVPPERRRGVPAQGRRRALREQHNLKKKKTNIEINKRIFSPWILLNK